MTPKQRLFASIAGTVGVAICCFTPLLAIALVAVGFSPYLDVVLLPALAILLVVTGLSYRQYTRDKQRSGDQGT